MNQNDKRSIIDNNVCGDHSRKSRRHCHSATLEKECTETVLKSHENQCKASRKKNESRRHSARNETKNSIRKVSETCHHRAESISQNPHVPSAKSVIRRVNVSSCKSLDKIDKRGKSTRHHKHSIHGINLQEEYSVGFYHDKDILKNSKDRQKHKECRNGKESHLCKEKCSANDLQTNRHEKYANFSTSTSRDSDVRDHADCKCKNCIHTLKRDRSKRLQFCFAQNDDGSARTRVFVPAKCTSYVSKKISCNDIRKSRLKTAAVESTNSDRLCESKFHNYNESKYNLDKKSGTLSSRRQRRNRIKINLYPIESNDESNDNPGVRIHCNNGDCDIVTNDSGNHFVESKNFLDKTSINATSDEFRISNDNKLERCYRQLCTVPENTETAVNEQDQSIRIVQNDNGKKSIKKQNEFEPIKISQDNNTDLKKSVYNDASTQYEQSTLIYEETKLSETSSQTMELKDEVYLSHKNIADAIKALCTLSESQCSTEMKRKSKIYECSRRCGSSKRNEKALRCAMARYIKKITLSETRHKNKLENEVKIIIGGNHSKPSKIKVMNEQPGEISIICYNVMESMLPIEKKNITLPRWATSEAGESSDYKSLNNHDPGINGTRTSLQLLHNKHVEHDGNRVNAKAEMESVKCSSEENQRNFRVININRDFTSKKRSSDMDAHFVNEHRKQIAGANYLFIPVAHVSDQCTVELPNETEAMKRETIAICKSENLVNARDDIDIKCNNDRILKHNVHPWLHKYSHAQNLQYCDQTGGSLSVQEKKESTKKEKNRCLDALYALWTNMRDRVNSTDDESISSKNSKNPNISSNKILAELPRPPLSFLTKFPSFENTDFDFTDIDETVSDEDISRAESSETGISHTDQQTNDSADDIDNQKLCRESNSAPNYPPPASLLPIPYSLSCVPKHQGKVSLNDYKEPPPACNLPLPETWKKPTVMRSNSTNFSILHFRKRGKSVNIGKTLDNGYSNTCQLNELTKNEMKMKKISRNLFRIFCRKKENEVDVSNQK